MYDIAIIGAGPAGSVFARELGKRSADVKILIIDGLAKGGSKVCGGLLSPDAQKMLSSLGITLPDRVLTSPQAKVVDTIDLGANLRRGYERDYINMDREAFDRYLLSLAEEYATVIAGRCIGAVKRGEGFEITVNDGEKSDIFNAKVLVGADGASSVVRRSFFPKNKIYKYVSIQEWYKNSDASLPDYSCIYDKKTSDSCSWTIRKNDYYVFGGAFSQKNCRKAFSEQKSRLEAFLGVRFEEAEKREACLVCSPRRYRDFTVGGGGVFLVGEAAGFISASSFEGISSALFSGRALAEALTEAKTPDFALRLYRKKTKLLRLKMYSKIPKKKILTSPTLRKLIMKIGVTAIKK